MSYARIQAIREGAGLLSRSVNEEPRGQVNGTNKDFITVKFPVVDSDYDDEVTTDDIRAYIDNVPVDITSFDPANGKFTVQTAPGNGSRFTVTYCFSPISEAYVEGKQEEADSWVNTKLKPYEIKGWIDLPLSAVPGVIATVAELYAAGLILTTDWGNRADTELTSKDGLGKIDLARKLLADYTQGLENENQTTNNTGSGSVSSVSDGDVFSRDSSVYREIDPTTDDEWFMRRH